MKKLSELMDELGFDPEASPAAKEAFIKYLIRASEGVSVLTPTEKKIIIANPQHIKVLPTASHPEQLKFDFIDEASTRSRISPKRHKI